MLVNYRALAASFLLAYGAPKYLAICNALPLQGCPWQMARCRSKWQCQSSKDGVVKTVSKNHGLFDLTKKLREGMVKCLIEHLNFSTGPNMWYTYGGGQSATSDSKCLELKKKI